MVGPEVGLKKYLGVMSRVPFSQLFDSMENVEKGRFIDFITPHLGFARTVKLRKYEGYGGKMSEDSDSDSSISAADWFESIINDRKRVGVREVDRLSPPLYLKGHSMGILNINTNANGFALIEVRGYSGLDYMGSSLTINRIREFVDTEANWFFTELGRE